MIILGLDPGSRYTGYGVIEAQGDRLRCLDHGRITLRASDPLAERLADLVRATTAIVERWRPDAAALETAFHGINSRSLIVLAQARGALLAGLAGHGLEIREYSPTAVKSAVSGQGRAGKEQVAHMVRIILSLGSARLSSDASDALAVAICCNQRYRLESLTAKPSRSS